MRRGRKKNTQVRIYRKHISVDEIMKLEIHKIPNTPINRAKFVANMRMKWIEGPNSELGLVLKIMSDTIRSEINKTARGRDGTFPGVSTKQNTRTRNGSPGALG